MSGTVEWKRQTDVSKVTGGYCNEYDAVYQAMTNKPSSTNAGYQNTMVAALVDGGYWARMDQLLIFATEINNGGEALINWVSPGTLDADAVSSPAWTQYLGYLGDGSADFISTNFNPVTVAGHYSINSASMGVYVLTDVNESAHVCGAYDAEGDATQIRPKSSDVFRIRVNNNESSAGSVANTDSKGLYIATRTSATAVKGYKNGSSTPVIDVSINAVAVNEEFSVLCHTGGAFSTNRVALYWVMDGVSDADAAAIMAIFNTYMTSIGQNTYNNP
jgi:hypothetical protein